MAAKQLLQLAVNKSTEADALAILQRSGVIFKTLATECRVDDNGQMVNEHGQVVTVNVGQVSGLIFPEPVIRDSGSKTLESGSVSKVPESAFKVPESASKVLEPKTGIQGATVGSQGATVGS